MKNKTIENTLITGGAGFIGSHITDTLMSRGSNVHVFDNFTSGTRKNLNQWLKNANFSLIEGDLLNTTDLKKLEFDKYNTIFHLAANPEVRVGTTNPSIHFEQNIVATYNLLEHFRKSKGTSTLVFASTSTVYGEPAEIPTPEDYAPLKPISIYGASKLACEALISAYAHTYNLKAVIYRLANTVGPRSQHGVVSDFVQKLRKNPKELEILGDGTQTKSYLYISDCIEAMLLGLEKTKNRVEIYNVGSEDQINVKTIAQIVIEELKLKNVKLTYTGSVDGGRGWKGDVKNMLLDITKLKALGWKPKLDSRKAVIESTRHLIDEQ